MRNYGWSAGVVGGGLYWSSLFKTLYEGFVKNLLLQEKCLAFEEIFMKILNV